MGSRRDRHARSPLRSAAVAVAALCAVTSATACGASSPPGHAHTPVSSSTERSVVEPPRTVSAPAPSTSHVDVSPKSSPSTPTQPSSSSRRVAPPGSRPVIVIDPGHSPQIYAIDPATGLNVSDYENEPEMRDVFAVAELVKAKLEAAGYRVIMTKRRATERISLGQRAAIANHAHASLALSIHDQAGSNGGLGFDQANSIVYYQSVGDYRETPNGKKVFFTDNRVAALSMKYGRVFRAERANAQGHQVTLQGDVGYDLGSRGLAAGNIWLVQLLSHVPWIYNEAGGNSAGMSGLNVADQHRYADGLVAGVEHCIPPPR